MEEIHTGILGEVRIPREPFNLETTTIIDNTIVEFMQEKTFHACRAPPKRSRGGVCARKRRINYLGYE
jgi:hypothetical protein